MRPPITILSVKGLAPQALIKVNASPVRAALASDSDDWTWEDLVALAYPQLLESVERRGITPRGHWTVIVDDHSDWRETIGRETRSKISAAMRADVNVRIVGMAHLVDSEDIEFMDVPNSN